ncbi:uncharacterized protein LOC100178905 [Ciona intestinalis]
MVSRSYPIIFLMSLALMVLLGQKYLSDTDKIYGKNNDYGAKVNDNTALAGELESGDTAVVEEEILNVQKEGLCSKPESAHNYTVCENLPLLPVVCGEQAEKREYDENGEKYRVPNIVHLVRVGDMGFDAVMFLNLRSVARIQQPEIIYIYYTTEKPTGIYIDRAEREIPCLLWVKVEDPDSVDGIQLSIPQSRSDVIRFTKILERGGIYVANDVILLKSLDPLRRYSFAAGREREDSISDGVMLVEPNSIFAHTFYQESYLEALRNYNPSQDDYKYAQDGLFAFYRQHMRDDVHIENDYLSRPPSLEGFGATVIGHWDLSQHYALNLQLSNTVTDRPEPAWIQTAMEEELRTMDNVYGEAARIAYFGSPDLVFKPGENAHDRMPTIKLNPLPNIEPDILEKEI